MLKLYELNLDNIECWKKKTKADSSKNVFVKDKIDGLLYRFD